jgi:hypothetical protein
MRPNTVENADRTRIPIQILGILLPNRIVIPVKLLGIAQEEGNWSGLEARGRLIVENGTDTGNSIAKSICDSCNVTRNCTGGRELVSKGVGE